MGSSQQGRGVSLPWERRRAWLREIFTGSRWRQLLAIITLIFVVIWIWQTAVFNDQIRITRLAIDEVVRAATAFREENGRCPENASELTRPPRAGRRYLRRIPTDAWGRDLQLVCPARHDPESLTALSAGPSGSFLIDDNIN